MMANVGQKGLDPLKFARRVVSISEKSRPKTRYAIAKNYFSDWILVRYLLPDRILDRGVHQQLNQ
jgi:hypothetical protein